MQQSIDGTFLAFKEDREGSSCEMTPSEIWHLFIYICRCRCEALLLLQYRFLFQLRPMEFA